MLDKNYIRRLVEADYRTAESMIRELEFSDWSEDDRKTIRTYLEGRKKRAELALVSITSINASPPTMEPVLTDGRD